MHASRRVDEDRRYVLLRETHGGCYSVTSGGLLKPGIVSKADFLKWVRTMHQAGWTVVAEPSAECYAVVLSKPPRS
jgi:hypothetical protein